jgi:hypothetical protein
MVMIRASISPIPQGHPSAMKYAANQEGIAIIPA